MVDRRSIRISVLAHASILLGFLFRYSVILPLLLWKTLKHSKYSEFQAKQATYYQIVALLLLLSISFAAEFTILLNTPQDGKLAQVDELLIKRIELAAYLLFSLYALYGAYRCNRGEEFRYLLIGKINF